MKFKVATISFWVLCLLLTPLSTVAQVAPPLEEGGETPEAAYRIKKITLTFFGGYFSGSTFFELPTLEDRTQLEEGSDEVFRYDGTIFELGEHYDAPEKKIDPGRTFGGRFGFYLSDQFHLDLVASVTMSKATTTFLNSDPRLEDGPRRELIDEDDGFTIYKGGGSLMYDITAVDFYGFMPYFGLGLGGVINRFTTLSDKTALYFELTGGLSFDVSSSLRINTQFTASTLSFETEELHYSKQVTYAYASLGICWVFDTVPDL
ncbi:MAG: hypothetical protein ABIF77_06530 [bacterium]